MQLSADLREVWKRLASGSGGEVAVMFGDGVSGLITPPVMNGLPHIFGKKLDGLLFRIGSAMQGCKL